MNQLLFLLLITTCVASVNAQINRRQVKATHRQAVHRQKFSFSPKEFTTVGLGVSAMNYFGDLAPRSNTLSTSLILTRPSIELSVSRKFGPYYSILGRFVVGQLSGSDRQSSQDGFARYRYVRNASFRNNIQEFSLSAYFNFPANHGYYTQRQKLTYHLFLGIGVLHHNPQGKVPATDLHGRPFKNAGQWIDLRDLGTEGQYSELSESDANYGIEPYSLIQPTVPFGFGLNYRYNDVTDISCEFSTRLLFTDYLDDVSQNYVDLGVLKSELARAMAYRSNEVVDAEASYVGRDGEVYFVKPGYGSEHPTNKRGDKSDNDLYTLFTIRVSYIMGAKMHKAKSR
jgi:hypothetical protein